MIIHEAFVYHNIHIYFYHPTVAPFIPLQIEFPWLVCHRESALARL
jgi:hypothetical protein